MGDYESLIIDDQDIFDPETGDYIWLYNENPEYGVTNISKEEVKDFLNGNTKDGFYEFAIGGRARGYIIQEEEIDKNRDWKVVSVDSLQAWVNE